MSAPRADYPRSFWLLWWTLGAGLLYLSIATVLAGLHVVTGVGALHEIVLGAIEAVAAVLFLVPRTILAGTIGLLATIAVAVIVHLANGRFPTPLLIYAAAVWFVFTAVRSSPRNANEAGSDNRYSA